MKKVCLLLSFALSVNWFAIPAAADAPCESECLDLYYDCTDECDPGGTFWCYDSCDQQYSQCWDSCQNCPSTRDYTQTTFMGATATGRNGCYEDLYDFIGGQRYAEYFYKQRITTYRETTNCDGSKTTTVLSTYDNNFYCWVRDPIASCSPYGLNFLRLCPNP